MMDRQVCGNQQEDSPICSLLPLNKEDLDEEPINLQTYNRSVPFRKIDSINVRVKLDDTLQALAVRYRCTVAELKRINKIDKENEIYARSYIKVPIQPFSLLTEVLPDNSENDIVKCKKSSHTQDEGISVETKQEQIDINVPTKTESTNTKINTIILNSVCKPSSNEHDENTDEDPCSEEDRLVPQNITNTGTQTAISFNVNSNMFDCSGDNFGISWKQLIVWILLISSLIPALYLYRLYLNNLKTYRN